jgi:TRAP-type C4-dicarboxylate transport system permease small subunit
MIGKIVERASYWLSNGFGAVSGAALALVTLLTACDIVGRVMGHPILGAYEIVSFAGGLVVALAVPITSRNKGHVIVDMLIGVVPKMTKTILEVTTRLLVIAFFLIAGYGLVKMGMDSASMGEMSQILHLPYYPVLYIMGGAFFVEAVVLVSDVFEVLEGGHE